MKSNRSKTQFVLTLALIVTVLLAATAISLAAPAESTVAAAPDAQTCTVYQPSSQDSYIRFEKQSENKGTNNELIVKTETGKLIQSLVQFNVSGLPGGAVIDSATLSLWVNDVRDGNVTIKAHPITAAWSENTVTWANFGASYGSVIDTESFVKGVKSYWATWDVSSVATDWVNSPASNFGILLESGVTNPKSEVKFKSKEDGTATQRPKLTICWSDGISVGPDRMAQGTAGQTTSYAHTVNVGAVSNQTVSLTAASDQGWTTRIYADNAPKDGIKDNNTPITQVGPLGPNASAGIVVEIDVPAGAANGVRDNTTVTASAQPSGLSDTASDRTQIGFPPVADPILDGKKDDAYTLHPDAQTQDYCDASGNNLARLMSTVDLANPDYVWVILEMDRRHVDNTYGANVHPSWGGSQSLGALDGSDAGQVILRNGNGTVIYDVTADYFETNILGSAGIDAAEGSYNVLPNDDLTLVDVETSIGYSLQTYCTAPGNCTVGSLDLLQDSPPIDVNYVPTDPTFNDWQFSYLYEFRFDAAAFGPSGFGDVRIDYVHVSPNKTGSNVILVEPCNGSIGDRVWRDNNQDGNQDAGELGLNGVQVNLYRDDGDGVLDTSIDAPAGMRFTAGDGAYDFTGLGPDTYFADVVDSSVPAGHIHTTNNDPLKVVLAQAQDFNDADFGYTSNPEVVIDKRQITAEPIYVGGTVDYTIVIDNTGDSAIATLPLQDYYDPDKLAYASVLSGPAPASAGGGVITWANVLTPPDVLDPGESVSLTVRFTALAISPSPSPHSAFSLSNALMNSAPTGNAPAATACTAPFDNSVYIDTSNCKCTKPDSMTIRYLGPGPTTITIGGNGSGGPFPNVNTGDTFTISVSGNEPTFTASGQPTQAIHTSCSAPLYPGWTSRPVGDDKHTQGGPFEVVSFSTGGVPFVLANPGSCTMGSIGDRVIVGNTVPDNGSEQGVSGVTVNLWGGSCPTDPADLTIATRFKTTTTNASGVYSFSGLMPGEYCAAVDNGTLPILYTLSTASPLDAASNGDTVDSCDFGVELVGTGEIGDRVFYDLNNDGLPDNDSNEPGLNGVTVNLSLNGQPFASTVTSGNGDYLFSNLPAGNFTVAVDNATIPPAMSLTTGNPTQAVTLPDGGSNLNADFGYRGDCNTAIVGGAIDVYDQEASPVADSAACPISNNPSSIGDYVWNDANGNGLQDADEDGNGQDDIVQGLPIPIGDVTINLWSSNGDAQFKPGIDDMFVASQTTAADGSYTFPMLLPGEYWVDVNESTLPGGYEFIPGAESGPEPHLVDLAPGEDYINADFGYAGRGAVTGIVYYDWDKSGTQGLGEPGIGLVEVCLWDDVDDNGLFDDTIDTQIACQTTDPQGAYNFTGQLPGNYLVVQTQPANLQDTTPNVLAVKLIVIGPSGSSTDNNFGEITYGSIGDFIFLDSNGNGTQEPSETVGVDGVSITVTNISTLEVFNTASVNGDYLVGELVPGTYRVEVPISLPGLSRTTASPQIVTLAFDAGTNTVDSYLDADFGYIAPTSVQLAGFTIEATSKGVAVRWSTSWEQNQDGFRVWRSSQAEGPYKPVSDFIVATNSPQGGHYEWLDVGVSALDGYWYKIESLPDGVFFGPVRDDPGDSISSLFIPLIIR